MKNLLVLFFTVLFSTATFSQRNHERREQIAALKVAFITKELSLTPDEAAKFWPVYNAFEDKQKELRKQRMPLRKLDNENVSEKDAAAMIVQIENAEDELYQQRKKFILQLKTILPAVKIIKLRSAEENFSRDLLRQYRERSRKN